MTFRGFIQKGFENSFGMIKGLLITSLLFGLWHYSPSNLYILVPNAFAGLAFGYVWQKTGGNTIVSTLMHAAYNTIGYIAMYFLF